MSRAMFGTSNHRLKTGRGKNVDQTQTCPLERAPVSETAGHLARLRCPAGFRSELLDRQIADVNRRGC